MKSKTVVLFVFTALCLQSVHLIGMDETPQSQENRVQQFFKDKLARLKKWKVKFINNVEEYKKCIKTPEGCPPELVREVYKDVRRVVAGVVAIGVGIGGIITEYKLNRHWKASRLYSGALKYANLKEDDLNQFARGAIMDAVQNKLQFGGEFTAQVLLGHIPTGSEQVVSAIEWIGKKTGNVKTKAAVESLKAVIEARSRQ